MKTQKVKEELSSWARPDGSRMPAYMLKKVSELWDTAQSPDTQLGESRANRGEEKVRMVGRWIICLILIGIATGLKNHWWAGFFMSASLVVGILALSGTIRFRQNSKPYYCYVKYLRILQKVINIIARNSKLPWVPTHFYPADGGIEDLVKWADRITGVELVAWLDKHLVMIAGQTLLIQGITGSADRSLHETCKTCMETLQEIRIRELPWDVYFSAAKTAANGAE